MRERPAVLVHRLGSPQGHEQITAPGQQVPEGLARGVVHHRVDEVQGITVGAQRPRRLHGGKDVRDRLARSPRREVLVGHPCRWRSQGGKLSSHLQPTGPPRLLRHALQDRVAQQRVAEAEARLGALHHQGLLGSLQVPVGVSLGGTGQRQELVGGEGQAEQGHALERSLDVSRQARHAPRPSVPADGSSSQLEGAEGEPTAERPDLLSPRLVEVREAVGQEPQGCLAVQRPHLDPAADATGDQACLHVVERRGVRSGAPRPGGQDQHHRLGDGTARQVVQQAQRCLVRLVDVIDDQQQTPPRSGQAHELGGSDEEPLVPALAAPRHVATGERPVELLVVPVVEAVQQARVPAAQVAEGLEDRGVGPRALDGRGHAAGCAHPCALGERDRQLEHRGFAHAGRPGDEQGTPPTTLGVDDPGSQLVPDVTAPDQAALGPCDTASGLGCARGPEQLGTQPFSLGARCGSQLAPQRLVEALELAQGSPGVPPVGQGLGHREVGLLVEGVGLEELFPPAGGPQQVHVEPLERVAVLLGPGLIQVVRQQGP